MWLTRFKTGYTRATFDLGYDVVHKHTSYSPTWRTSNWLINQNRNHKSRFNTEMKQRWVPDSKTNTTTLEQKENHRMNPGGPDQRPSIRCHETWLKVFTSEPSPKDPTRQRAAKFGKWNWQLLKRMQSGRLSYRAHTRTELCLYHSSTENNSWKSHSARTNIPINKMHPGITD